MAKNDEKMIFGIGFDLATGVDEVIKQWNSKEAKRIQKAIDERPFKIKLDFDANGIKMQDFKSWMALSREAEKLERERIKNAKEWQKVADQAAMAETRRANVTNESNARIERQNRKAEASERNKAQAVEQTNEAYKRQEGYVARLMQRMAVYFSIHQAFAFLKNIRETTAEFELQRVALGALIQDGYKANEIFEQIKIQAVKSPYEVQDLVTYTKQLAAYGVKADDLIGTMNKLADISAGLGTDMNRIILAYGQIQAAGVLKGTELRQLTELGLPMVDLLAEYYSTLRNEVISTSEVFDMISNKEIPFQAVQDILNDLTSEGGRFYQMQAKQAETLAGQWSNMKDSLSIMFDEIGRSEEVRSLMEGMIDVVKWLALNWREVWQSIKLVGGTYAILKSLTLAQKLYNASLTTTTTGLRRYLLVTMEIPQWWQKNNKGLLKNIALNAKSLLSWKSLSAGIKSAGVALKQFSKTLLLSMLSNPIGWIMSLVGAIGIFKVATSEGRDAMEAFQERQREMVKESIENSVLLEANFKRLAKEVVNSTEGSERQREALRRLKQQYGDIFPEWKLTVEYLQKISEEAGNSATAFDSMAASIRSYTLEATRQNLIENYQTQIQDQFKDTFANLTDSIGINYAEVIGFIINNFDKYANIDEFLTKVKDLYIEAMGFEPNMANAFIEGHLQYDPKLYDYNLLRDLAVAYFGIDTEVNRLISSFDKLDKKATESTKRVQVLGEALKDIENTTGGKTNEEASKNLETQTNKKIKDALIDLFRQALPTSSDSQNFINKNVEDIIAEIEQAFKYYNVDDIYVRELQTYKSMANIYDDQWKEDLSNMTTYLDDGRRLVRAYSTDQIQSFNDLWDAIPEVAKRYKELDEQLEGLRKTYDALKSKPIDEQDTKEIENYRQEISKIEAKTKMLYSFLEKYGGLDLITEKDSNKVNPNIKKLEDEYAMVEKIYKKYEEFRKLMGDEQARIEVEKYFEGVDLQWLDKAFSTDELKSQAQEALRILETFWGDTKKAQQNLQFKIGDIDFDDTKRELEDRLKKLSNDISRTKTAKEFFDRMLGMTGDKELSATLTLSVYGTTGNDLEKLMSQEIIDAFKGVDISEAMLGGNKWNYDVLAGLVSQLPEEQQKNAQSIVDNWRKANADILNDVIKSYEDFMTYEERKTRVVEKYAAERKKIMGSELPEAEKEKYVKATNKAETKAITDIAIEEFKASADWAKSFEELENLATPTIERLMQSLREFIDTQDDLSPEQLKALTKEYQKLYDGLIARNPFKAITDSVKEYKTAMQGVKLAQDALDAAKAMGDEDLIAFAERGLTDAFDDAQKAASKLKKGVDGVGDKFSQAASDVEFFAKALGLSEDKHVSQFLTAMANAFKGVSIAIGVADLAMKLFDGTIKSFLASNPIGWILLIVSAIISAVQAIMNARLNRINDEIEALQDKLDNLEYAYNRLQKSAERAFGTEYIQNYQRQLDNLEAQVEAYEKQLSLERSKGKKADKEKIKEYEDKVRDTTDAIKDMYGTLSDHFLGQDLTSAARDFASAWIDAYKEFSNATDAMKEKFQDMIQNMIVESLLAKVMEKALEPVFTMIDNMGDGDFYSTDFWQRVMATMETATENGVVGAQNVMAMLEQMGINLRGLGGEMTGISRDIATASEESILGLAAGINTQNFYISQVPTKLDTIISLLRGDGAMPQGSAITLQDVMIAQNQFLSHLPTIAQHTAETVAECKQIVVETRRTADALDRVIKPDGTRTTYKLNVVTTYQG